MSKKDALNISWKAVHKKIGNCEDAISHLEKHNKKLDELLCSLYDCVQVANALKFYEKFAAHVARNMTWIKEWKDVCNVIDAKATSVTKK